MNDDIKNALALLKHGLDDLENIKNTVSEIEDIARNALVNFKYSESLIESEMSKREEIDECV